MIVVLRALGIGDLATAVPALRGLRAAHPALPVALAAPAAMAPLVELTGAVDRLLPVDGLAPLPAVAPPPDLAVNLHGRGPQSHRLLQALRPGRLWAYACPAAGHADGPAWHDDEHEVIRWCRLLDWYGVACDPADLRLRRPPPDRVAVGVTVVHPGAASARRRWPADRFAEVARRLAAAGHRVVVTGSARERPLAEAVAAGAGLPATAVHAGQLDLSRFAALLSHARLVIAADTGTGHLATAFGVPSVLLFGPTSPARWGPTIDRHLHRVLQYPHLSPGTEEPGTGEPGIGVPGIGVPGTGVPGTGPSGAGEPDPSDAPHPALAAICVDEVLAAVHQVTRDAATT